MQHQTFMKHNMLVLLQQHEGPSTKTSKFIVEIWEIFWCNIEKQQMQHPKKPYIDQPHPYIQRGGCGPRPPWAALDV